MITMIRIQLIIFLRIGALLDRFEIKAEVHRSGTTLTAIALATGLHGSACRLALIYPIPRANAAIAAHLNKSVHELWPEWFDRKGHPRSGISSRIRAARRSSRKARVA